MGSTGVVGGRRGSDRAEADAARGASNAVYRAHRHDDQTDLDPLNFRPGDQSIERRVADPTDDEHERDGLGQRGKALDLAVAVGVVVVRRSCRRPNREVRFPSQQSRCLDSLLSRTAVALCTWLFCMYRARTAPAHDCRFDCKEEARE